MKKYYQPELTNEFLEENPMFWSCFVYSTEDAAQEAFPDSKIIEYSGDDIEEPIFIDKTYEQIIF